MAGRAAGECADRRSCHPLVAVAAHATGGAAPEGGSGGAGGQGCGGDLQTDPDNCGTCGHSCRPGGCALGVCLKFGLYTYAFERRNGPSSDCRLERPERLLVTGYGLVDIPLEGSFRLCQPLRDPPDSGLSGSAQIAVAGSDYFIGSWDQSPGSAMIYAGSAANCSCSMRQCRGSHRPMPTPSPRTQLTSTGRIVTYPIR